MIYSYSYTDSTPDNKLPGLRTVGGKVKPFKSAIRKRSGSIPGRLLSAGAKGVGFDSQ
jgi:hypothetical protein